MTNAQSLGTIEATNPVLAVAPLKEETEMLRATDKITALYCRLSVEDLKEDKKGGKEDESNSIQNQKMILLQYAKEHRFPNPTFFVDDGYSGTNFDRPGFQAMLAEIEAGRVAVCCTKDLSRLGRNSSLTGLYINFTFPKYNVRYIAINDHFDTIDPNSTDNDVAGIKNWFNEFFAKDTQQGDHQKNPHTQRHRPDDDPIRDRRHLPCQHLQIRFRYCDDKSKYKTQPDDHRQPF